MNPTTKLTLLAALMIPGAAIAAVSEGDMLGTTEADVQAALEAQGYVVTEIELENDEIEAEVTLDGAAFEIEVAVATGMVLEIEADDDIDEDGDDD